MPVPLGPSVNGWPKRSESHGPICSVSCSIGFGTSLQFFFDKLLGRIPKDTPKEEGIKLLRCFECRRPIVKQPHLKVALTAGGAPIGLLCSSVCADLYYGGPGRL
jgi:hypothetical protein